MHQILLTQRVEVIQSYNERRDCLDQNWVRFIYECGAVPHIVPNNLSIVNGILRNFKCDGIILTGGNNLCKYNGDAPERDEVEKYLLKYAIKNNIPILGICRGMQLIQDYFGIKLRKVENHVATIHILNSKGRIMKLNSYHNYASDETVDEIEVLTRTEDNIIEVIKHKQYEVYGMMHHPERVIPFCKDDIEIIKNLMKI